MAGAQRFISSHEIMGSYSTKSPQIRNLDVQAVWNGLLEHPVHVKIHCTIKPESELRVPILECDGDRVAVTSVVTNQVIKPGHVGRVITALRQYSDELSGETLTVSNAGLFLRDSFMITPSMNTTVKEQKSPLSPRSGDIFSDGPRWAKDLPGFDRQTSASAIGALGYQFSETKDNDSVHLVPHNFIIDDNRSTSADTVEINLLSRSPSPFGDDGLRCLDIPVQGSSEGAGDQALEFSSALSDGSPRKLRVKKRAKCSKRLAQNEKAPWQSPSKVGFSPKSKETTAVQPSTLSSPTYGKPTPTSKPSKLAVTRGTTSKKSNSKSTEPLRQTSGNCLGAGTPGTSSILSSRVKQSPLAMGRLAANTPQRTEENAAIRAKPFLSEPRALKPVFDQSVQSLNSDGPGQERFNIFEDLPDNGNESGSPNPPTPSRTPLGLSSELQDQPHSQQLSPTTYVRVREAAKTCTSHHPRQTSSPTTCLRVREASKTCMPHISGQKLEVDPSPIWVIDDGKLVICFPEAITLTPFEIDIEAEVSLVSLDGHDWQSFSIAVCPQLGPGNVTGLFSFIIEPELGQSKTPDAQFRTESLFGSHVFAARQIIGMFIAAEPLQLSLRFKKPMVAIPFYTMEIGLCGTAVWSEDEGFQIKYHACLSIEHPDYDLFADQITLYLSIKNWFLCADTCYLGKGETSVVLCDSHQPPDGRPSDLTEASLAIVRDAADTGSPVELVFTVSYGRISPITVAVPQIHPADGKVVAESVLISDPSPGLFVEHWARSSFSTWKTTEHVKDGVRMYRFDRIPIPFAFPEGLKDDIMVKLVRQVPVHFKALEEPNNPVANVTLEDVVQNFELSVAQMLGGMLECRVSLDVQVSKSPLLLTIDHHDWNPKLSLIDGRLATEDAAEWRETVDGNSTLFKTERVVPGQSVRVEFQWDEWDIPDGFKEDGYTNFVVCDLPRVVGKTVLGGSLQCHVNGGSITLADSVGEIVYRGINGSGRGRVRLPTLRDGYKMKLAFAKDREPTYYLPPRLEHNLPTRATPPRVLFAGGIPLVSRQVRFADEGSEGSSDAVDEISATVVEDSDLESMYSSGFDENPLPLMTGPINSELSEGSSGAFQEITATIVEDSELESIYSSEFDENPFPALTESTKSELSEGSRDALNETTATVVEDSDLESIYSSEFDDNPLPPLMGFTKRVIPWSTTPFRKARSIIDRNKYRLCCLLWLSVLLPKLLDPKLDAATSALNYVQQVTTNIEQLVLSIVPVPMDDATLRKQVPQRHTANSEDATTSVQEWVLLAIGDGDVGAQAPGAGSRGDTETVHYTPIEVTNIDSETDAVHSAGHTGNDRSVRDWIDYTLGWKGQA